MSTKFNKSIAMLLSVVMVFTMLPFAVFSASAAETTGGLEGSQNITKGSGTAEDPYIIENVAGLNELAQRVNGEYTPPSEVEALKEDDFEGEYFKLDANFDNSATALTTPIGKSGSTPFAGIFDGNGKTVTLKIDLDVKSGNAYAGLFGFNRGTIKNVSVDGTVKVKAEIVLVSAGGVCGCNYSAIDSCYNMASVIAESNKSNYVGGVCGFSTGKVANCYNSGSDTISASGASTSKSSYCNYAGGVCGYNYNCTLANCYNSGSGTISASGASTSKSYYYNYAGGVCGFNYNCTLANCYNSGSSNISASNGSQSCSGGVCGNNYNCTIVNCYNSGSSNISASNGSQNYAGGVCGYNNYNCTLANCYNSGSGTISASGSSNINYTGGVCGENQSSTIVNCYYKKVNDLYGIGGKTNDAEGSGVAPITDATALLNALNTYKTDNKLFEAKAWKLETPSETYPTFVEPTKLTGTGTESDPYKITSVADLNTLAYTVNTLTESYAGKYIKLENDITDAFTAKEGCICGNGKYIKGENNSFKGTFNGNGKTVKLNITEISTDIDVFIGLFGCNSGTIKNVGVKGSVSDNSNVYTSYAGGVCGWNTDGGTIENCYCSGGNISDERDDSFAGGVCGWNSGNVANCYYAGSGTISAESEYTSAGGVCGWNSGNVANCYYAGSGMISSYNAGGVCGQNNGNIANCYYAGSGNISADFLAGGVCGWNTDGGTIENCYYDSEVNSTVEKAIGNNEEDTENVKGLTTAEMKSEKAGGLLDLLNTFVEDYNVKLKDGDIALSEWVIKTAENSGYPIFGERTAIQTIDFSFTITAPKTGEKLAEKAELKITDAPSGSVAVEPIEPDWRDDLNQPIKTAECNGEYTVSFSIDAYVHGEYKFTENTAATATVNGKKATIEGDYETGYTVSYTFDKVHHTWDDGKVVKNATKNHGAVRLFTCTVCQEALRTEYLPQSTQTIKLLKKKYKAKNKTVKIKAQAKGSKLRFRALNKSKYYRVNKYGRIRFRNGAKGTYKIKVKIRALVNNSYKQATTTKVIKVKVK